MPTAVRAHTAPRSRNKLAIAPVKYATNIKLAKSRLGVSLNSDWESN